MRKNKKSIVAALSATILLSSSVVTPSITLAQNKVTVDANEDIKNLEMIKHDDGFLKYTYSQNGENFLVEEQLSETKVVTTYFIEDKNGDYKKDDKVTTKLNKDRETLVQTSEKDGSLGEISLETFAAPEGVEPQEGQLAKLSINSKNSMSLSSSEYVPWEYSSTSYGTNTPTKWAIGIISLAIASITKVPATASFVTLAANHTYQSFSSTIYYSYEYYKRGDNIGDAETMTHRYVYASSDRNDPIARTTTISSRSGMEVIQKVNY